MSITMKKILSSILLLSLGFGLSSCSKESTKGTSKSEAKAALEDTNGDLAEAILKLNQ